MAVLLLGEVTNGVLNRDATAKAVQAVMSRISRRLRVTFTAWPSLCRGRVICCTPASAARRSRAFPEIAGRSAA
ncbi:hypothetical protein ESD82_15330 [Paracoccus pantotrophus]|uniref:Uncharacterized protein n=1 Tax=Paracoccus pantotrophus TaxID=82367 RepID=A0AAE6TU41_PARPN|nr:hypothetical protein [Paracoccus pantotrophus]QFG37501.1 hypothetical protein ESD82_15330 [Paracoccus pantotrophus]